MSSAGLKVGHAICGKWLRRNGGPIWLMLEGAQSSAVSGFSARHPGAGGMNSGTPVVHVVDDDASFRKAVGRLLRASGYEVALYESGDRFLDDPNSKEPGCILLDMRMSGLSGLELQERLRQLDSILPIVFLTGYGDVPSTVQAMKGGAQDFLTKPVKEQTLLEAVQRALARYRERRQQHDRLNALRALAATLTPRESQVFDFLVRGRLNKQIAFDLGTSERTIKAHRQSIMQKLQVQSLAEAVSIAERLGFLNGSNGSSH
jgi:FixJ family two-component response regulator